MRSEISASLQESLAPWLQISVASERRYVNIKRESGEGSYEYISMDNRYALNLAYINSGLVSLWANILVMHLNTGECKITQLVQLLAERQNAEVTYYTNLYRYMVGQFLFARVFGLSPFREWKESDTPETILRLAPFEKKIVYEIIYNRYRCVDYLLQQTLIVE